MQALRDFLAVARKCSFDVAAVEEAAEFLNFKLLATDHVREEILQIINKGVTTFEWVAETLTPGAPTGPISQETESLVTLFILNLRLSSFLSEAASVRDAVLKMANAAFDLKLPPKECRAPQVHERITELFKKDMGVARATGLEAWGVVTQDAALKEVIDLRNEAMHQNLVKLVQKKPWEVVTPPPGPGKWRSEFLVVVSPTKQAPLDRFVVESADKVRDDARVVLHTLHNTLDMLMWQRGGPKAAALRRTWRSAQHSAPCAHGIIDNAMDANGPVLDSAAYGGSRLAPPKDINFCVACGERVHKIHLRKRTDGSTCFEL